MGPSEALLQALQNGRVSLRVSTSAAKTELVGSKRYGFLLSLKAQPHKGLANKELVRFCTRLAKKRVRIVAGLKTKTKIIELVR